MTSYILGRLAQAFIVMTMVLLIVFLLMFMSGDPALLLMPPDASREDIEEFRRQMGFDQPLWHQFIQFAGRIALGDFGRSWRFQEPALPLVLERLPITMELAISALLLSLVIAIPIGIISAIKRDTKVDGFAMVAAMLGQSVPGFWLGLMLILIFSVQLGWLPTSGRQGPQYLILPAVSLGLALAGRNARLVRSCMLEVLNEDYIRTARAKGVKERTVLFKHTMRAVFAPIITLAGLDFAGLIGGAIITETIFNLPGLGRLTLRSTFEFDLPVVLATTILAAAVVIIMNLIIDMLYAVLDPRVRI